MPEREVSNEDCAHALNRVYQFHDRELTEEEAAEIRNHLLACEPCLDEYDVEQAMRVLIRRCCGAETAPDGLRMKIRATITHTVITTENG